MIKIIILYLATFAISNTCNFGSPIYRGSQMYCNCYSGFIGDNCTVGCSNMKNPEDLKDGDITFNKYFGPTNSSYGIDVEMRFLSVKNRGEYVIGINQWAGCQSHISGASTDMGCDMSDILPYFKRSLLSCDGPYPIITKCSDIIRLNLPYEFIIGKCLKGVSKMDNYNSYDGWITVTVNDKLNDGNLKQTVYKQKISIKQRTKYITVSNIITNVDSNPLITSNSIITSQEYIPLENALKFKMLIRTSKIVKSGKIEDLYKMSIPDIIQINDQLKLKSIRQDSISYNLIEHHIDQTFDVVIDVKNKSYCRFNNEYFKFRSSVMKGYTDSILLNINSFINVRIYSEDICSDMTADIYTVSNIVVYSDDKFTKKLDRMIDRNDNIYVSINTDLVDRGSVAIDSINIIQLTLMYNTADNYEIRKSIKLCRENGLDFDLSAYEDFGQSLNWFRFKINVNKFINHSNITHIQIYTQADINLKYIGPVGTTRSAIAHGSVVSERVIQSHDEYFNLITNLRISQVSPLMTKSIYIGQSGAAILNIKILTMMVLCVLLQ